VCGSKPATESGPGEALRVYAETELRAAREALGWSGSRRHAGVHQARKSMRRVRATLALAGKSFGRAGQLFDKELQRINRSLSPMRDGQALVEALQRLSDHTEAPEHAALLKRARGAAERRRAALARATPVPSDAIGVLDMLLPSVPMLPWQAMAMPLLELSVGHSIAAVQAAGARALQRNKKADWHRWRRRARRLTQQDRALATVPMAVDAAAHKAHAVHLGHAQDYQLLIEHCGRDSPFAKDDRETLRELAESRLVHLRGNFVDKDAVARD
jgi:CHAD domain-containing protein